MRGCLESNVKGKEPEKASPATGWTTKDVLESIFPCWLLWLRSLPEKTKCDLVHNKAKTIYFLDYSFFFF